MSKADELPSEIIRAVARALYKCEKRRADHCDKVFAKARNKPVGRPTMEPWEECANIYLGDAKAAINAYLSSAFSDESA